MGSLQPIVERDDEEEHDSYWDIVLQHELQPAAKWARHPAQLLGGTPLSASCTAWHGTMDQMQVRSTERRRGAEGAVGADDTPMRRGSVRAARTENRAPHLLPSRWP
jgi:hypothetical protein